MDKNQALVTMDAHLVRVEAERVRHTERRQRYMLRLYPVLKGAPPEQRDALLHEARRYAFTRWPFYVSVGLVVAAATLLLRKQLLGSELEIPAPTLLVLIALAPVPAAVLYSQMRGCLRLAVGARNPREQEGALRP